MLITLYVIRNTITTQSLLYTSDRQWCIEEEGIPLTELFLCTSWDMANTTVGLICQSNQGIDFYLEVIELKYELLEFATYVGIKDELKEFFRLFEDELTVTRQNRLFNCNRKRTIRKQQLKSRMEHMWRKQNQFR